MGQAGSSRGHRQPAPQKRENEEVPGDTNVSCSGCNSVFCQWRNIQPGNWQKGSKAAWYIDEMHGVDVVETAEGAWSKLRVDGVVHENAVMWHRAQCSTCSRPVGVQRGITNPALGIAEDRKGWFLVCCSDVTLGLSQDTDIVCRTPTCNTVLCQWGDQAPGSWVKAGKKAYYFRQMDVAIETGTYGSLRTGGVVVKNAIRWDTAKCRRCAAEIGTRRGPRNPAKDLPDYDATREGMVLVSGSQIAMQPRRWWTTGNHHRLLPVAREWVINLMLIARRLAFVTAEGADAGAAAAAPELPNLPLEMLFHILLHLHGGHMLPRALE
eukprot:m.206905 g.206905  ORF g.206905 m.206905 type:complete len:324 (-) comp25374_c0_seq2:1871-2842(-)